MQILAAKSFVYQFFSFCLSAYIQGFVDNVSRELWHMAVC